MQSSRCPCLVVGTSGFYLLTVKTESREVFMDIFERCAVELNWDKACGIISEEIKELLGLHVQCKAKKPLI